MIQFRNVTFRYANTEKPSIKNMNLQIHQGECVLLCGESGCGKTTLTRLINGLTPHFYEGELEGEVYVHGMLTANTPLERLSHHVGSVFQNPKSQFFCVDTTGELAFGAENRNLSKADILSRIHTTVEQLQIQTLMNRNIFHLSGGEKQKIACAGVHVAGAEIIVLDEPTSNLDAAGIEMLAQVLAFWKSEGKTIVIAEHRLNWLTDLSDRVIYMENGRMTKEWSANSFFKMGREELHSIGLRDLEFRNHFLNNNIGLNCLRQEEEKQWKQNDNYLLSGFQYAYKRGSDVLSLPEIQVPEHAIVAVVGRNGSGKSTFSRCLCGIQKGFQGKVLFQGKIFKGKKLRSLGYMVMQDINHQLFTDSVIEEVTLGLPEENDAPGETVLKKMDLLEYKDRHPMSLSGGQKQRTAICSAYLSDRKLLIFDEPTSGLDYRRMQETADLIREISKEKTVFIVTHDMELVEICCTHILTIKHTPQE